jgi:ribosomal protein S18 acetylase RimI-like enzyme
VEDRILLERNLRGLAALHRLVGRHAGTLIEIDGAVGSIVHDAPDYPWLSALVCEPGADLGRVLEGIAESVDCDELAVWACGTGQVHAAIDAGFTRLIATVPAMSMTLDRVAAVESNDGEVGLAEVGALSDVAYDNKGNELERTLTRIPSDRVHAYGRRDATGRLLAAALFLDVDGDCSVQYVATRPDAQRLGHGLALLGSALARAYDRGVRTTSLQSSQAGMPLYRRLGYRTVGQLELRQRDPEA